ncbi:DUF4097 family beta strand repeat protein [Solirubrobacter sp. CPCC 204708]|uniref:DUF4097 domain-containing protein n=1 Tax=Solirubrobacter deserti TaxID=2282478 RepID=A0ABT4RSK6_9ACTN|nr:DUF4097 family beta strand repeat-containing protein [Solirubrobacter deserti]MBE2319893.1 DUF4097 family beta strand repeat protein [Solirubrobacter deserti]MDA0141425.1 DUF4097 domain-containing protein [Solirubrobacter deserti]
MLSPWGRVVAISALLVVGGILVLAIASVASTEQVRPTFVVEGTLEGLTFDVADSDIVVVGGGRRDSVEVRRDERYAFGHRPRVEKLPRAGTFGLRSRCPTAVLGPCSVSYRILVPDNVPLEIRTSSGDVWLRGYRGSATVTTGEGAIDISGYCGNALDARASSGTVTVQAACAPPRMILRTASGDVRAVMPAGRYDLDAETSSGDAVVRGIIARPDAPYSVQVLSGTGDVSVEGRS